MSIYSNKTALTDAIIKARRNEGITNHEMLTILLHDVVPQFFQDTPDLRTKAGKEQQKALQEYYAALKVLKYVK